MNDYTHIAIVNTRVIRWVMESKLIRAEFPVTEINRSSYSIISMPTKSSAKFVEISALILDDVIWRYRKVIRTQDRQRNMRGNIWHFVVSAVYVEGLAPNWILSNIEFGSRIFVYVRTSTRRSSRSIIWNTNSQIDGVVQLGMEILQPCTKPAG